jgi:hypothetical protein
MAVDLVTPVMAALRDNLRRYLQVSVGRLYISPGLDVAWDDCCNGQAWVRLVSMAPFYGDTRRGAAQRCGPDGMVLTMAVGALRCAAVLDDNGTPPSVTQLNNDAAAVGRDAADLLAAITCFDPEAVGLGNVILKPLLVERWDPLGPDGVCVGGEWLLNTTVGACPCPDPLE